MNVDKASIFTIAEFGNFEMLLEKLKIINKSLSEAKDDKDKNNNTLLQKSIIGRKYDIAEKLLDMNCNINCISNNGYNELHLIAYNLGSDESFDIAKKIIEKGGDLNLKDKEYGNTPFNYFCQMAIRKTNNNSKFKDFLLFCMRFNPELNVENNCGKNIIDLVKTSGNTNLIEILHIKNI